MPRRSLSSLGVMVREKRGVRKLREVANEIGIGAATLMRVENGRIPDVATFGKICKWLGVDPGSFLGFEPKEVPSAAVSTDQTSSVQVSAHLRADQTPKPETVQALAQMILMAAKVQPAIKEPQENDNP